MFSFRLFPSFEKPVVRQRFLNVQPQRRGYGGIGAVLAFSALCAFLLALPDTSQPPKAPARAAVATPAKPAAIETTAGTAAAADDEPAVKLSALCDKPTARRACAEAKAAKEARLAAAFARAEAETKTAPSSPSRAVARQALAAARTGAEPEDAEAEQAAPPPPKQKMKTIRVADDTPVERLVHVYDHIAPDGRRVPVYRRSDGRYEFGTVANGEYRQTRRAELGQPRTFNFFGLQ